MDGLCAKRTKNEEEEEEWIKEGSEGKNQMLATTKLGALVFLRLPSCGYSIPGALSFF